MVTIDSTKLLGELKALGLPGFDWKVEAKRDWSGDEAVWVWAIVDDEALATMPRAEFSRVRAGIRRAVSVTASSEDLIVYTRFVAKSEALAAFGVA